MAVVYPTGVAAQGNIKVAWVPTIADVDAPTVAELTAAGAVDLSCFLDASWAPSAEQAKNEAKRRLCTIQTTERLGSVRYTLADITYVYDPQGTDEDADNEAYTALTAGNTGFFVERRGLDAQDVDFAAAQFVDIYPAELGEQRPAADVTDEAAEFQISQVVVVTGQRTTRAAIV